MTKVLVVDDERVARSSMLALFESAGYRAEGAVDADTALAMAEDFAPHVAIVDWKLRGSADGLEIAGRLLELFPDMRLIVTTGFPLEDLLDRQRELSLDLRVLLKPFSFEQLLSEIERA